VTKVKVGGMTYTVLYKSDVNIDGVKRYDTCDRENMVIEIRDSMNKPLTDLTLIHEIVHAIDFEYCIDMTESQVEQMANGLYQVLVDNEFEEAP